MHTNETSVSLALIRAATLNDSFFSYFLATTNHVNKLWICIDYITLFEDDGSKSDVSFIESTCGDFKMFQATFKFFILLINFNLLPLGLRQLLMSLSNILVFIIWKLREVICWNYLSEDAFTPCFPRLLLILYL